MAAPTFVQVATTGSAASISGGYPTGTVAGDFCLLCIETANQALSPPAGWVELASSPQGQGSAGAAGGVRLTVFYRFAPVGLANYSTGDSGDHQFVGIMAFRGVDTVAPINAEGGATGGAASTTVNFPSVTTTVDDCLVVGIAARDLAASGVLFTFNSSSNTNLSSLTERMDAGVATGFGGGLGAFSGVKSTAGSTGPSTGTLSSSTATTSITVALAPVATGSLVQRPMRVTYTL